MSGARFPLNVLCIVAVSLFSSKEGALAQLNADQIEIEQREDEKNQQEGKFRLGLEFGVGQARFGETTYIDGVVRDDYDRTAFNADVGFVLSYMLFRSDFKGISHVEVLVTASLGIDYSHRNEIIYRKFRPLGHIGIEVGGKIPLGESWMIRPFASFGPGITIFDELSEDEAYPVWIPRFGFEVKNGKSRVSVIFGAKMIIRSLGDTRHWMGPQHDSLIIEQYENDYLGLIGLRLYL